MGENINNNGSSGSSGCLINFFELKEGQQLFHMTLGLVTISGLEDDMVGNKKNIYPVKVWIEKNVENRYFTSDGKDDPDDKYPSLYLYDPFLHTLQLLKAKDEEIQELKYKIGSAIVNSDSYLAYSAANSIQQSIVQSENLVKGGMQARQFAFDEMKKNEIMARNEDERRNALLQEITEQILKDNDQQPF